VLGIVVIVGGGWAGWRVMDERRTVSGLPKPAGSAPNVLLIVWDTVRRDQLSTYGYKRPTTPRLDEIARRGVRFDHTIAAAPWTLPSHASMFTGRWPHEHKADWLVPFDARFPVVAEAFDSAGYRTGGFVGNMFYCSYEHGLGRGFTRYVDYQVTPGEILYSASLGRLVTNLPLSRRISGYYQEMGYADAEDVNHAFLRWVGHGSDRPYFAFLNYIDAHVPRLVPEPFDTLFGNPEDRPLDRIRYSLHHANMEGWVRFKPRLMQTEVDAYDGGIAYLDRETDRLLRTLEQRGLLENTVVVITSDHGELFGEHGVAGHGTSLYREATDVPLVIIAPGRVPAGKLIEQPASLRNMAVTLMDLAGLTPAQRFPGVSLLRYVGDGPETAVADTLLSELGPQADMSERFPKVGKGMTALVARGFYYVKNGDGSEELYRFPADTVQGKDLAADPAFSDTLQSYRATVERFGP